MTVVLEDSEDDSESPDIQITRGQWSSSRGQSINLGSLSSSKGPSRSSSSRPPSRLIANKRSSRDSMNRGPTQGSKDSTQRNRPTSTANGSHVPVTRTGSSLHPTGSGPTEDPVVDVVPTDNAKRRYTKAFFDLDENMDGKISLASLASAYRLSPEEQGRVPVAKDGSLRLAGFCSWMHASGR